MIELGAALLDVMFGPPDVLARYDLRRETILARLRQAETGRAEGQAGVPGLRGPSGSDEGEP